ncbi:MAG TPA: hypothetical protein VFE33_04610 [Thermoanaerobaculia bacterium]|nr:hypothetical protein [Thermoanaerobaculia bacterium]
MQRLPPNGTYRPRGAVPVVPEKQAAALARTQTRRESLARMKERPGRPR